MALSTNEVGAFEAKSKLSELLRETERGNSFVILRRGKPVARLVPVEKPYCSPDRVDLLGEFHAVRATVKGKVRVRELIGEGRR